MTEFKTAVDRFASMLRQVNITAIDEDDPRFVVYSVRVPGPGLDEDAILALGGDDAFGADLAQWLKMGAKSMSERALPA
jgi:hypothetical protein